MLASSLRSAHFFEGRAGVTPKAGLIQWLTQEMSRAAVLERPLQEAFQRGLQHFKEHQRARLAIALAAFDAPMRAALFDVLYLLHVNDPALGSFSFPACQLERRGGMVRERSETQTAALHEEGAPHGVEALEQLDDALKEPFRAHCQAVFEDDPFRHRVPQRAVRSVHTLGSIGTIGHKSHDSDLDLEICYDFVPFEVPLDAWDDRQLLEALQLEWRLLLGVRAAQNKLSAAQLRQHKHQAETLKRQTLVQLKGQYPFLVETLLLKTTDYRQKLRGKTKTAAAVQALDEITRLLPRALKQRSTAEAKVKERLWQKRLERIQAYLLARYPQAEVYLFSASLEKYRQGQHGTTLDSKESSGSAYDLILNHDTLLPGIPLTPAIPLHFLLSPAVNEDAQRYERTVRWARCGLLPMFQNEPDAPLVDLGATPTLSQRYVAAHSGAVYWEAFKASSGRLYKAYLNLLRYETLLDPPFNKSIIQLMKEPAYLNQFTRQKPEDERLCLKLQTAYGLLDWDLAGLENEFPSLRQDPWWLRYKLLKLAYAQPRRVPGVDDAGGARIARAIDLAFAMHVRLSDVITKPGRRKTAESPREAVLHRLLAIAFPQGSRRRQHLEHLFIGETSALNAFESELRELFQSCLNRITERLSSDAIRTESNQEEFKVWFHFYQRNFDPPPNAVPQTIMKHLKVPRGRLQIGYHRKHGWFFRSIQRESKVGKRFDTFGMLEHLPEEVMLIQTPSMPRGLTDCILNGYYGILQQGTLKETRTAIELLPGFMDLGNHIDNNLAFLRPDMVHRLMDCIIQGFPHRPLHYLDCIRLKRKLTEVLVCVNINHYGRLAIISRDNLQTWYVDEFDHPPLFESARVLATQPAQMLGQLAFQKTLIQFFRSWETGLEDVSFHAWVNPNSLQTDHAPQQMPLKEQDLAALFKQATFRRLAPKLLGTRTEELKIRTPQLMFPQSARFSR